jgi:hypothetical protein
MPTRYDLDEHGKIRPENPEDFDAVKETPDDPLKSSAENAHTSTSLPRLES